MALFRDRVEYRTQEALDLLVTLEDTHRHLLESMVWTSLLVAVVDQELILRDKLLA